MIKGKQYVKKIIVLGGFGGGNAGDEAQIDQTYRELKSNFSDYEIKVLSHVQQHTFTHHGHLAVGENSRMAIWHVDRGGVYWDLSKKMDKIAFLFKGYWVYVNSILIRHGLYPLFIDDEVTAFLYEIKTADLVYISGGGFLTGKTLSRLYDHLFLIMIANQFEVPVILSGHNIGMWDSAFTKWFAAKGFSKAKIITTRDQIDSIEALKEIGIKGNHIFATHDDALFCEKCIDENAVRKKCQVKEGNKYVVICPCIANIGSDPFPISAVSLRVSNIIQWFLQNTTKDVVILPMGAEDVNISDRLYFINKCERVKIVRFSDYNFQMIRGIISFSEMCLSMRHHPIIFAIGESTPAISLNLYEYFAKKNLGALESVGMENMYINLMEDDYFERFCEMMSSLEVDEIRKVIEVHLGQLKNRKKRLYEGLKKVILR